MHEEFKAARADAGQTVSGSGDAPGGGSRGS